MYARVPMIRLFLAPEGTDPLDLAAPLCGQAPEMMERLAKALPEFMLGKTERTENLSTVDVVLQTALALQREFGFRVNTAQRAPTAQNGSFSAAFEYVDEYLGLAAGHAAVEIVKALIRDADTRETTADDKSVQGANSTDSAEFDRVFSAAMKKLELIVLPFTARLLIWEAKRRGIPWARVHPATQMLQMGHGHKRQRFRGTYSRYTSNLATNLATSKAVASDLMRGAGIPVPRHELVDHADTAVVAAQRIGYPVVIKPNAADRGVDVQIDLQDDAAVRAAFAKIATHGRILVEEQVTGNDHRIMVIRGNMVGAGINLSARVAGDGRSTIRQLIQVINSDPRRGDQDHSPIKRIRIDDEVMRTLAEQNHDLDSVPDRSEVVLLRRWWKGSYDPYSIDVTETVHPDNRAIAERAARLIDLDVAGIDFITTDISCSWREIGGAINEINPTPGFHGHLRAGTPDMPRLYLESFFPSGDDGRIPTATIVVESDPDEDTKTVAAGAGDILAAILTDAGHTVGRTSINGLTVGGHVIAERNATGPGGARVVFNDPTVTAAVLETNPATINRAGIGYERTGVSILVQQPGWRGYSPHTGIADMVRLMMDVTDGLVVLDGDVADDLEWLPVSQSDKLCWVGTDPVKPPLVDHIARGGCVIAIARDGQHPAITLWHRGDRTTLARLKNDVAEASVQSPTTEQRSAMLASAAALGLDLRRDKISAVLRQLPFVYA